MDLTATKDCHCLAARRREQEIIRLYEKKLRLHVLRTTQFPVLATLSLKSPTPNGEPADVLGLERTTLTWSANRMEDDGVIADVEFEDDWVRRLKLTLAGREKVKSTCLVWKEVQDEINRQGRQLETGRSYDKEGKQ